MTSPDVRAWVAAHVFPDAAREAMLRGFASAPAEIVPAEPAEYAGACLAALESGRAAWCLNPKWGAAELAEARALIDADDSRDPGLRIATGGTGGRVKFVRHTAATLAAAVSGFSEYAGERLTRRGRPERLHAVHALPCHHVSGLMPVVRARLTGGDLVFTPASFRAETPLPPMPGGDDGLCVVSLVATQLHRLLERADGSAWLRGAGLALVGGSAVAPELLARARAERLPLGVSYGMTETAALAALHPPEAFLRGDAPVAGELLPHLTAGVTPEGRLALGGASVGPDLPRDADGRFVTGDLGFLDTMGRVVVTGRADRVFVSGGEKVDPAEVERAILATGLVREALVVAVPDAAWGAVGVAVVTPRNEADTRLAERLREALAAALASCRLPKRVVVVAALPLDERGKPDRAALAGLVCHRGDA